MDYTVPLLSFLASLFGSGLVVAMFNYFAEYRRKQREDLIKLRRLIAKVYDQLHYGEIRPEEFTQLASSLCIELDVLGYYKPAWVLRRYLGTWRPGSAVDTTEVKQLLFDVLDKLPK